MHRNESHLPPRGSMFPVWQDSAAGLIVSLNQTYSGLLKGTKKVVITFTVEGTIEFIRSKVHKNQMPLGLSGLR